MNTTTVLILSVLGLVEVGLVVLVLVMRRRLHAAHARRRAASASARGLIASTAALRTELEGVRGELREAQAANVRLADVDGALAEVDELINGPHPRLPRNQRHDLHRERTAWASQMAARMDAPPRIPPHEKPGGGR